MAGTPLLTTSMVMLVMLAMVVMMMTSRRESVKLYLHHNRLHLCRFTFQFLNTLHLGSIFHNYRFPQSKGDCFKIKSVIKRA